jgi:hypothetical protein
LSSDGGEILSSLKSNSLSNRGANGSASALLSPQSTGEAGFGSASFASIGVHSRFYVFSHSGNFCKTVNFSKQTDNFQAADPEAMHAFARECTLERLGSRSAL